MSIIPKTSVWGEFFACRLKTHTIFSLPNESNEDSRTMCSINFASLFILPDINSLRKSFDVQVNKKNRWKRIVGSIKKVIKFLKPKK